MSGGQVFGVEMKHAASPGGTFFILLPGLVLSTHANAAVTATQLRRKCRF
jgi:hypothetical protein